MTATKPIDAGTPRRTELIRKAIVLFYQCSVYGDVHGTACGLLADDLQAEFIVKESVPAEMIVTCPTCHVKQEWPFLCINCAKDLQECNQRLVSAGAEPWPSEAQMSALCSSHNLDVDPVAVPCHEAYRMIRSWLVSLPPSPAHQAALERAEKAESKLARMEQIVLEKIHEGAMVRIFEVQDA